MQCLHSKVRSGHVGQQQRVPCRFQRSSTRIVRVRSQQQNVATVSTSQQQAEPVTEKEQMSRAYNEQMARQMGWANPYEVWHQTGPPQIPFFLQMFVICAFSRAETVN